MTGKKHPPAQTGTAAEPTDAATPGLTNPARDQPGLSDLFTSAGADGAPDSQANHAFVRAVEAHRGGRLDDAERLYGKTLQRDPHHVQALNNLGVLLRARDKPAAAEVCFRRALSLDPTNAGLHSNLGNLLHGREDLEGALRCHQEAANLRQADGEILHNLGRVLTDLAQYDLAVTAFEKALAGAANPAGLRTDLGLALMMQGDLQRGARAYEARRALSRPRPDLAKIPDWDGEPLADRHLLIYADGSLADSLSFLRFLPWALAAADKVTLEISPELYPLAAHQPGPHKVIQRGQKLPAVDYRLPLGSLLLKSRCRWEDLSGPPAYLSAPSASRLTLACSERAPMKVGINWAHQENGPPNHIRRPPFAAFLALTARPDITVYALQKGERAVDLLDAGGLALARDLSPQIQTWADMAAVVRQLDLVITVDGPLAHLAGALGVPCWVALSRRGDWRWRHRGPGEPPASLWYPRTRLFDKDPQLGWDATFAAMEKALDDSRRQPEES